MLSSTALSSPVYISVLVLFFVVFGLARWLQSRKKTQLDAPIIGTEIGNAETRAMYFYGHATEILQSAYTKFKSQICLINTTEAPVAILPHEFLPEVMKKHRQALDPQEVNNQSLYPEYMGLELGFTGGRNVIKSKLNPKIGMFVQDLVEEGSDAVNTVLPYYADWTSIKIYGPLAKIVARMSARVFVGPELCRDENWLKISTNYAGDFGRAVAALRNWSPLLRPFVGRFLPEVVSARKYNSEGLRFLSPILRTDKITSQTSYGPTLCAWFYDVMNDKQKQDIGFQARLQLSLILVSVGTSADLATQIFYDLAAHPEYIPILRDEVKQVLEKHGGFSKQALYDMKKLDSFMKESQRLSPSRRAIPVRVVIEPFKLNNLTIPKGQWIGFNGHGYYQDPENFPHPEQFDGLRFYNLRYPEGDQVKQDADAARKHQFVSVSSSSFNFGFGDHACPGRFFAATVIKIIVALILQKHEVKLPEGQGRPRNFDFGGHVFADPTKEVLLKHIVA